MILVLDSESTDGTQEAAWQAGCRVVSIPRASFDHGATRQSAVTHVSEDTKILVYLTQDAILAQPDALAKIVAPFEDESIGVAYGRQLPRPGATPIEAHARHFSYPPLRYVHAYEDKSRFGMRVAFCSNSFAAYRKTALLEAGGFPANTLFGEDLYTAARILRSCHKICYAAEAIVFHSHEYEIGLEFRRYFDIGASHRRNLWLLQEFGKPEGHGVAFVKSELKYLRATSPHLIPLALMKTAAKFAGYRLGRLHEHLPQRLKIQFSMNKTFWRKDERD
jgi:rhamnosyltransferase